MRTLTLRLMTDINKILIVTQAHLTCTSTWVGTSEVGSYGYTPLSLPKFQHSFHELLKENGFTHHVYLTYYRCYLH